MRARLTAARPSRRAEIFNFESSLGRPQRMHLLGLRLACAARLHAVVPAGLAFQSPKGISIGARLLLSFAFAFALASGWTVGQSPEAAQELADAHFRQATLIDAARTADPRVGGPLRELQMEMESLAGQWESRAGKLPDESDLLGAIPAQTLANAQAMAEDSKALSAYLKDSLRFEELLALTAFRNPSVKAAQRRLEATLQSLRQAAYLEDLLVRYRAFVRELDTQVGPQTHRERLAATFPFPAGLTFKGQIARQQVDLSWLAYQTALRQALNQMAKRYFDLQYVSSAIEIVRESTALFQRMEEVAIAQLRVDKASQADALKTQALLDVLQSDLETLLQERHIIMARANALLDLPGSTAWANPPPLDLADPEADLRDSIRQALKDNQQLEAARKRLTLSEAAVRLAEVMTFPLAASKASQIDLNQGSQAGPTRRPAAAFPSRPRAGRQAAAFGANAAYLQELRLRVEENRQRLEAVEAEVELQVRDAQFRIDAARREHQTYRQLVVPKLHRAYHTMRGRYNTGRAPFIEFLDAGRSFLEASLQNQRARRDHNLGLIDLQEALGRVAAELVSPRDAEAQRGR